MAIAAHGLNAADREHRVVFGQLRQERPVRPQYVTFTHIGLWAMDKLICPGLLSQGSEGPVNRGFGSPARHHGLYDPWLEHRVTRAVAEVHGARAGTSMPRAALPPCVGIA
jgi:hypothetical protein